MKKIIITPRVPVRRQVRYHQPVAIPVPDEVPICVKQIAHRGKAFLQLGQHVI